MSLFGLNTGYSLKDLLENPILQNPTQLKRGKKWYAFSLCPEKTQDHDSQNCVCFYN